MAWFLCGLLPFLYLSGDILKWKQIVRAKSRAAPSMFVSKDCMFQEMLSSSSSYCEHVMIVQICLITSRCAHTPTEALGVIKASLIHKWQSDSMTQNSNSALLQLLHFSFSLNFSLSSAGGLQCEEVLLLCWHNVSVSNAPVNQPLHHRVGKIFIGLSEHGNYVWWRTELAGQGKALAKLEVGFGAGRRKKDFC